MNIQGEKIILVPIRLEEKEDFYQMATHSEGSCFWFDEQELTSITRETFFLGWNDDYFDRAKPDKGQCFWIVGEEKKVGVIAYNTFDANNKKVELDILIGQRENMGKGYGSDALKTIVAYLFNTFDLNKIWIEPKADNPRAVKAYEKAGFQTEGLLRQDVYFDGRFVDCIRMAILRSDRANFQN